jgi:hypothetical protein
MRLKITSDGSRKGTKVLDAKSNEEIEGVMGVEWKWSYDQDNAQPYCVITVESVPLEAVMTNSDSKPEKEIL